MKKIIVILTVGILVSALQTASAALLESWENSLDNWAPDSPYTYAFSTTTGVTDGSYSLALTAASAPNYGSGLYSDYRMSYTTALASASTLSLDVYAPAGSFGGYLQIQLWENNADTGYNQIPDGSTYLSTTIGSETTLTWTIPTSISSVLATSSSTTQIGFQLGGGAGGTMYLDNVRTTAVPEPATLALAGLGMLGLLVFRRRKA